MQAVQSLENEISGLQEEKSAFEEKVLEAQERSGVLESERAGLKEKVETLGKEKAGLVQAVQSLENEISGLQEKKSAFEEKVLKAQERSGILESEKGVLTEELSNARNRIRRIEAQLADANRIKAALRETGEDLSRELEKQKRLNEIIRYTLEEERSVPPWLRVIKQLLPFRSSPAVLVSDYERAADKAAASDVKKTAFAGKESKPKIEETALHDKEVQLIPAAPIPEIEKAGAGKEKPRSETDPILENRDAKQMPEAVSFHSDQDFVRPKGIWEKTISVVQKEVERAGLAFVPYLEPALNFEQELPHKKWAAFSHISAGLPEWMAKTRVYKPFDPAVFTSMKWSRAQKYCRRIFVFSKDHADILAKVKVTATPLKYPLPKVAGKWSWNSFEANPEKKIIQVGWWFARMHAIHLLPDSGLNKFWIKMSEPAVDDLFSTERSHLKERMIFFDHMDSSVTIIDDLPRQEYEKQLCANIALVHYYDAGAPDFLLECIARHTPLLVNALPGVRELLGDDYPLYYYFYKDAAGKAADFDLVRKAHEHLKQLAGKMGLSTEALALQVRKALKED